MRQIHHDLLFLNGHDWRDFATVKRWKSQLTLKSRNGGFPEKTWKAVESNMPRFLSVMQKTPDDLIEEALSDNENGEIHISTFFSWLKKQGIDHNSAVIRAYGVIRGFYKHNKITTQGWHTPRQIPKEMEVPQCSIVVGKYNHAVLIKGLESEIGSGIEQRDIAIKMGATGATTLLFKEGKFFMPGRNQDSLRSDSDVREKIIKTLQPEDKDVIIIGSADKKKVAELATKNTALLTVANHHKHF